MTEQYKIKDVLEDTQHIAHEAAKDMVAKLESGEINLCGCLGPMYGEPYCPCQMKQKGLQEMMDNNPVRKAAEYESAKHWKEFMESGGFAALMGNDE